MKIRHLLALAAVAAVAALVPAAAQSENPMLVAIVGTNDAFEIDLANAQGISVTHLDPGTYTIVVHDRSRIHNFHLRGPGVDMKTDVGFVGDKTWTVTLTNGVYGYQCDVHAYQMSGTFSVGRQPAPPAQLTGSVGPGRRISLLDSDGTRLRQIAAGRAVVTVRDRTRSDNFHLRGPGVNKTTGIGFRGRARWTVTLKPGRYTYRSDRHKSLRGTFTVTSS